MKMSVCWAWMQPSSKMTATLGLSVIQRWSTREIRGIHGRKTAVNNIQLGWQSAFSANGKITNLRRSLAPVSPSTSRCSICFRSSFLASQSSAYPCFGSVSKTRKIPKIICPMYHLSRPSASWENWVSGLLTLEQTLLPNAISLKKSSNATTERCKKISMNFVAF